MRLDSGAVSHRRAVHGGPHSAGRPGLSVLDFSSSISPAGPPPAARRIGAGSLEAYPDPDCTALKRALSRYTGLPSSHIAAGSGATELIYNFFRMLPQRTIPLIPVPTFGEYEAAARLSGHRPVFVKMMDISKGVDRLVSRIPYNGCLILCNPSNPAGSLVRRRTISQIIAAASKKSAFVMVDESFIELVPDSAESVANMVRRYGNLLVLRSMTKSFALAGARIGYALGSPLLVRILERIRIPWSVSGPAQEAGIAALQCPSHLLRAKKMIKTESRFLQKQISQLDGFECVPGAANYILVRTRLHPVTVRRRLLKYKILVRDCGSFRGLDGYHIRIAVRTRRENKMLLRAMRKI